MEDTQKKVETPVAISFYKQRCPPKHYLWLKKLESSKMPKDRVLINCDIYVYIHTCVCERE